MQQLPIGIFDSGIGGLTVMQELINVLPGESFIYFGDTARLPYGNKSPEAIIRCSVENAMFLMEHQIKLLIVACNTASAYAMEQLRELCGVPVIGVIEPGAQRAVEVSKNGKIAVLGTKATIKSDAYRREILSRNPQAQVVSVACPLFVPLVEEQFTKHPAARLIVRDYLSALKGQVDTLLLGCTHYPLLRDVIAEEIGDVAIVDSATTCALEVAAVLAKKGIAAQDSQPIYRYFVSDDPNQFQRLGKEFLGRFINHVNPIPTQMANMAVNIP